MILYLLIITFSATAITLICCLLHTPVAAWGILPAALIVWGEVVAVIVIDGLGACIIRHLPEKYFEAERKCFTVTQAECRLWRALGVRIWRDKIPELGGFSGFHKDRVREPKNASYLARFLLETNYGTAIHLVNALTGFLLLAVYPHITLSVALPVAVVNLLLSLMPFGVLRYNTPKLLALYRRVKARDIKKAPLAQIGSAESCTSGK